VRGKASTCHIESRKPEKEERVAEATIRAESMVYFFILVSWWGEGTAEGKSERAGEWTHLSSSVTLCLQIPCGPSFGRITCEKA